MQNVSGSPKPSQAASSRPDNSISYSNRKLLLTSHLRYSIKRLNQGGEISGTELLELLPYTVIGQGRPSPSADRLAGGGQ
jgi:hypothetical protein